MYLQIKSRLFLLLPNPNANQAEGRMSDTVGPVDLCLGPNLSGICSSAIMPALCWLWSIYHIDSARVASAVEAISKHLIKFSEACLVYVHRQGHKPIAELYCMLEWDRN